MEEAEGQEVPTALGHPPWPHAELPRCIWCTLIPQLRYLGRLCGCGSERPSHRTLPHVTGLAGCWWPLERRYWCGGGCPGALFLVRVCHGPRHRGVLLGALRDQGQLVRPKEPLIDHAMACSAPVCPSWAPKVVSTEMRVQSQVQLNLHSPGCLAYVMQKWASVVTCSEETGWTLVQPHFSVL